MSLRPASHILLFSSQSLYLPCLQIFLRFILPCLPIENVIVIYRATVRKASSGPVFARVLPVVAEFAKCLLTLRPN